MLLVTSFKGTQIRRSTHRLDRRSRNSVQHYLRFSASSIRASLLNQRFKTMGLYLGTEGGAPDGIYRSREYSRSMRAVFEAVFISFAVRARLLFSSLAVPLASALKER